MRALTLWQPWASLVAGGAKRWETRSWGTAYRGLLLIHAAARRPPGTMNRRIRDEAGEAVLPPEIPPRVVEAMIQALGLADFDELPRGAVLAVAELADCVRIADGRAMHDLIYRAHGMGMAASEAEFLFGDWTPGRFAWGLGRVRPTKPIAWAGARGLWTPPLELLLGLGTDWKERCPDCRIGADVPFVDAVLAAKRCARCRGTGWVLA